MSTTQRSLAAFALLQAVALAALAVFSWSQHRLEPIPDLILAPGQKISCISYDPHYGPGDAPYNPGFHASLEQIDRDLEVLSHRYACVRTYSVSQGLDQVPAVARRHGMKVLLGAWINADPVDTATELTAALRVANANTDVVRALVVGNEVMLRREQTQSGMLKLLQQARAQAKVPITYADVWEFWLRNKPLAAEVDFVTIHILPFWEDNPVGIGTAVEHVARTLAAVRTAFDKPVLIGETGWPSLGRQREGARPSPVNQARFIREFVARATAEHWDYSLIEAVDQPWKRRLEGTVGGYWGVLDSHRLGEKFALVGPMANRVDGPLQAGFAIAGALVLASVAAIARRGLPPAPTLLGAASMGGLTGLAAAFQWRHMWDAYPGSVPLGMAVGGLAAAAALAIVAFQPRRAGAAARIAVAITAASALAMIVSGATVRDLSETASLVFVSLVGLAVPALLAWALGTRTAGPVFLRLASGTRFAVLFCGAVGALLLWADSRYRDFPYWLYLVPAIELALGWRLLRSPVPVRPISREERVLAAMIGLTAIFRLVPEPFNPQAIAWTLLGVLLAWTGWSTRRRT